MGAASANAPEFYYTLAVPELLSEFFCIEKVTPRALRSALLAEGYQGELPEEDGVALGLCIVPMGFCWAVWIAQITLLSALLGPSGRVVDQISGAVLTPHRPPTQG